MLSSVHTRTVLALSCEIYSASILKTLPRDVYDKLHGDLV
jgi:hypothetical protein